LKKQVLIIFCLGALQGVIGWFMVKSGLVDKPHVSHYRLATHLITALGLMIYIFWVAMSVKYKSIEKEVQRPTNLLKWFIGLVVLQLIFGAFVAGLKGGYYYNTFPKMGSEWIPSEFSSIMSRDGMISLIESPGIVQFIHRIFAYTIVIVLIVLFVKSRKLNYNGFQKGGLNLLLISVGVQFILGVLTVLYAVPVSLGVVHQFGAILLLLASFYFMYSLKGRSVFD
jgi:cytochrome c oxidase assembly protein subunit 15